MRNRHIPLFLSILPFVSLPSHLGVAMASAQCSGAQAQNEQTNATPPQNLFVPTGQTFYVNVDAITNAYTTSQAADIVNGINSWAGVNGLNLIFASRPSGFGVITVSPGTNLGSDGFGAAIYGAYPPGGYAAPNQITSGTIQFDLSYQIQNCANAGGGSCSAYDPNAPNADVSLQGTAAHEMGHVLGLDNVNQDPCQQTSNSVMGGDCGTNNNGDGQSQSAPTSNGPTDCDKQNVSAQASANSGSGGGGGEGGGGSSSGGTSGGASNVGGGNDVPDCTASGYEDWDDSTNTLTYYYQCD
jgi:hypothetical protein